MSSAVLSQRHPPHLQARELGNVLCSCRVDATTDCCCAIWLRRRLPHLSPSPPSVLPQRCGWRDSSSSHRSSRLRRNAASLVACPSEHTGTTPHAQRIHLSCSELKKLRGPNKLSAPAAFAERGQGDVVRLRVKPGRVLLPMVQDTQNLLLVGAPFCQRRGRRTSKSNGKDAETQNRCYHQHPR